MTRTSSAETAARYHVARHSGPRSIAPPVYATDGIAIPRRKRRVLLDLSPGSAYALLRAVRGDVGSGGNTETLRNLERMLVATLEQAR